MQGFFKQQLVKCNDFYDILTPQMEQIKAFIILRTIIIIREERGNWAT